MGSINNDFIIKPDIKLAVEQKPDVIKEVTKGVAVVFCGRGVKAINNLKEGKYYDATLNAAQQANKAPDARNDIMGSVVAITTLCKKSPEFYEKMKSYNKMTGNPIDAVKFMQKNDPELFKLLYDKKVIAHDIATKAPISKITEFRFFKDTFIEKKAKDPKANKILKTICNLDNNLLDTGYGEKIVKIFDKNATIETIENTVSNANKNAGEDVLEKVTSKCVKGNIAATFTARTLGRMPLLNVLFSVGLEIPNLIKSHDKEQVKKSLLNIGITTLSSALFGALLTPIIPPVGSLIGAAIGGYIGCKFSRNLGETLFNKQDEFNITNNNPAAVKITA